MKLRYSRFQLLPFKVSPNVYAGVTAVLSYLLLTYVIFPKITLDSGISESFLNSDEFASTKVDAHAMIISFSALFLAYLSISAAIQGVNMTLTQEKILALQNAIFHNGKITDKNRNQALLLSKSITKRRLFKTYKATDKITIDYTLQRKSWLRLWLLDPSLCKAKAKEQCIKVSSKTGIICNQKDHLSKIKYFQHPNLNICLVGISKTGKPVTFEQAIMDELQNGLVSIK